MKKNKHDHKGTKALKLSIFFTLMLAPFLAVLFKCAYVTFNKNAKDSYSGYEQQIQYNQAEWNNLEIGKKYVFKTENYVTFTTQPTNRDRIDLQVSNFTYSNNNTGSGTLSILYYSSAQSIRLQFTDSNNTNVSLYSNSTIFNNSFVLDNVITLGNFYTNLTDYLFEYEITSTSHLDNAFYYAIDEAMESPYFAWARTSALYTATSGLTNGMGITTQAIPTLIVYWLILTAIYIIIDIVIESFTYLTHCIMNRFD